MNTELPFAVVALKTVTLVLGCLVTYFAVKAAKRTGVTGLGYLAVGFGVVTLGSLLAGVAHQLPLFASDTALVVEAALTTVGFAVITLSLYVTRQSV
ncbi:DUF7521 family protein [Haloferax larsenii]|uniref:YapH protein n=1 Tax=Haloferax larsenii TaxID=302484 RepID=A0A1H7IPG6_HALLR|nr:hypothetical protein [Haloferax larsenii]SEK63450.1 hypothetical protein SAMN04488691_101946 [Haloferax larsenii]